MNIKVEPRAINSRTLFDRVDEIVHETIRSIDFDWSDEDEKSLFLEFINTVFSDLYENNEIEQWKLQSNNLNNTIKDIENGTFVLDVSYKQRNCLNVTKIKYTIQENYDG